MKGSSFELHLTCLFVKVFFVFFVSSLNYIFRWLLLWSWINRLGQLWLHSNTVSQLFLSELFIVKCFYRNRIPIQCFVFRFPLVRGIRIESVQTIFLILSVGNWNNLDDSANVLKSHYRFLSDKIFLLII